MNIKAWTRGKKITLSLLLAAILVIGGICVVAFLGHPQPALFHFDPSQVRSVDLYDVTFVGQVTDSQQIEEIVNLLNDFTYEKTEELSADLLGGKYHLCLNMDADWKKESIGFYMDSVRIWEEDGGSVMYYGPAEYLQPLAEMVEEAKQSQ